MTPSPLESERRREGVTRQDISNILGKITRVENAFVECQQRINKAVEERIGEHSAIRELRVSIDGLKDDIIAAVENGDVRLKGHDSDIGRHDLDIKDCRERLDAVENAVERLVHRLDQIEFATQATRLSVEDGNRETHRAISALHDTINIGLKAALDKSQPKSMWSKIPLPAYGIITVAALGVVVYVLTGDDTIVNLFKRGS